MQLAIEYRNDKLRSERQTAQDSSTQGKQQFVARAAELDKGDLINLLGQYFDRVVGLRVSENALATTKEEALFELQASSFFPAHFLFGLSVPLLCFCTPPASLF